MNQILNYLMHRSNEFNCEIGIASSTLMTGLYTCQLMSYLNRGEAIVNVVCYLTVSVRASELYIITTKSQ